MMNYTLAKPKLHTNCKLSDFDPEERVTSVPVSRFAVKPLQDWIRGISRFLVLWGSAGDRWRRATAAELAFGFIQRGHSVILLEGDEVGVSEVTIAEALARDFVFWLGRCFEEQDVWHRPITVPTNTNDILSLLQEMLRSDSIIWPCVIIYSQGWHLNENDAFAKMFFDILHGAERLRVLYLADLHLGVMKNVASGSEHFRIPPGDATCSVEVDPICPVQSQGMLAGLC